MKGLLRLPVALSLALTACQGRNNTESMPDTARPAADSPASAGRSDQPRSSDTSRPAGAPSGLAAGKEPGTVPATPTPTVTSESSIAAMRRSLQQLESASAQDLQARMAEHSKSLGDLMTTMRVEAQAATAPSKEAWLAAADTVEGDLDKLAVATGEELRTAFRAHRTRVTRLLDGFRVLVPAKSP